MMTARTAPSLPADLAPLAPRRSLARNLALAALAVLVLVGAALSPAALRPSLTGMSGGAWTVELPEAGSVLVVSQLDPSAWPHADIVGVEPVPGAEPVAAWVLDSPPAPSSEPSQATEPRSYLQETYPGLELPADGNLPYRVRSGASLDIAVVWRIDNCAELGETFEGATSFSDLGLAEAAAPHATVRSAFGTESPAPLGQVAAPASFVSPDSPLCD